MATNRLAILLIDHYHVRRRMVDLDNIQRQQKACGGCMHRCKDLSCCLCAEPFRCNELGIEGAQSSLHGPIVWHRQALFFTCHVDELQEIRNARTFTRQEELLDDIVDYFLDGGFQKPGASSSTALALQ
jgi:hypothetical protein